ncbi:beta carbonic anhydrase clade D [Tricladium varicosporioides]|nr:beta carbonic anhydrase clade D [Hymenoscyphus varicosporioides]
MSQSTPNIVNLVESNKKYAASFDKGNLPLPPAKKYTVVACMDARVDPAAAYGIDLGDAHVIRNAGGSARDSLRSLVISQQLLGTREIIIVKHTGCGMLTFRNEDAVKLVRENLGEEGVKATVDAFGGEYLPLTDLEASIKEDVKWLQGNKALVPGINVSGWVHDLETGKVRNVV